MNQGKDRELGSMARDYEITDILRRLPCFSGLGEGVLQKLRPFVKERRYPKGKVVFVKDEPCSELFVVKSGSVKLYITSPEGREQTLRIMRRGDFFCGAPVFDAGHYPVSAVVLEEAVLASISRDEFEGMIGHNSTLAMTIIHDFCKRVRDLVSLVEELSFKDVSKRLARLILEMAEERGIPIQEGVLIKLPLTHREIASLIGTEREVVCRTLSRFQKEGLIRSGPRQITLLQKENLQKKAVKI